MSTVFEDVLARVAADGLHPAVVGPQLSAFLDGETPIDSVVLSDMKVDPETGVRIILTMCLLTPTRVIFADVTEEPLASGEGEALRTSMRVIPLRAILETRVLTHVLAPSTTDPAVHRFQVEFITAEAGDLFLEHQICGSVLVEGQHLDIEDLAGQDLDEITDADVCTDPVGLIGAMSMNAVLLMEDAGMSGPDPVEALLRFAATVSRAVATV